MAAGFEHPQTGTGMLKRLIQALTVLAVVLAIGVLVFFIVIGGILST